MIRIISDLRLLIMMALMVTGYSLGCIWMIQIIPQHAALDEVVPIQILIASLLLLLLVAVINIAARSICILTLLDSVVVITIPFKKNVNVPYKKYSYIYHGYYFYGNYFWQGFCVHYIVFSQEKLSSEVLSHVNTLKNTETTFKILLTKRNYKKLCMILPDTYRQKIDVVMNSLEQ